MGWVHAQSCVVAVAACSWNGLPSQDVVDGSPAMIDSPPGTIDAVDIDAVGPPDAVVCTAGNCGGTCRKDNTCVIDCFGGGSCGTVTCPPGIPCEVNCTAGGADACGTVTCAQGQPCVVNCFGSAIVALGGSAGCGTVDCNGACSCDVSCTNGLGGGPGCQNTTQACPSGCENGNGCDPTPPPQCNTCP